MTEDMASVYKYFLIHTFGYKPKTKEGVEKFIGVSWDFFIEDLNRQ